MSDIHHLFRFTKNKGIMGADKKTVGIMLDVMSQGYCPITLPDVTGPFG